MKWPLPPFSSVKKETIRFRTDGYIDGIESPGGGEIGNFTSNHRYIDSEDFMLVDGVDYYLL